MRLGYPPSVSPPDGSAEQPMRKRLLAACLIGGLAAAAAAQDTERGRRLFTNTGAVTGKPVGDCLACHASGDALRGMIENRGGDPRNPRFVRAVLQKSIEGAVPGAANAKAQYRGVLTATDLRDLAAYIARAKQASFEPQLAGAPPR